MCGEGGGIRPYRWCDRRKVIKVLRRYSRAPKKKHFLFLSLHRLYNSEKHEAPLLLFYLNACCIYLSSWKKPDIFRVLCTYCIAKELQSEAAKKAERGAIRAKEELSIIRKIQSRIIYPSPPLHRNTFVYGTVELLLPSDLHAKLPTRGRLSVLM